MTSFYPDTPVYRYFGNWRKVGDCVQTPWRGKRSTHSLSFTDKPGMAKERIETVFDTKFAGKFEQAVSRYEKRRIATLHSSALLSLLCFHKVSGETPLHLNIDGADCVFTEALFEVKNQIENGNPSNIDVVLCGKRKDGDRSVRLYLESKFTEFLTPGNKYKIKRKTYIGTYKQIFGEDLSKCLGGIQCQGSDNEEWLRLVGGGHYCGGIKQMISHYMGLRYELREKRENDPEIYLGSIIYDFEGTTQEFAELTQDYKTCYISIADALNRLSGGAPFRVIPELLTYQNVFDGTNAGLLTDKTKEFYKLG